MYKILIGTNREAVVRASGMIDWANLDIQAPYLASTSEEAIGLLNTTAIDAVGMSFEGDTGEQLQRFLHTERPSMAIFPISTQPDKQQEYLTELRDMLRHMHTDYVDQALDNESIRVMVRDELVHNLLCGLLTDMDAAERKFKLIRAHLSFTRTCVVYEMDLPQGEIYARDDLLFIILTNT